MKVRLLKEPVYSGLRNVEFPIEVEGFNLRENLVDAVLHDIEGADTRCFNPGQGYSLTIGDECEIVDETASPEFTQAQAQEMYALLKRWSDSVDCMGDHYQAGLNEETEELLKQLESE